MPSQAAGMVVQFLIDCWRDTSQPLPPMDSQTALPPVPQVPPRTIHTAPDPHDRGRRGKTLKRTQSAASHMMCGTPASPISRVVSYKTERTSSSAEYFDLTPSAVEWLHKNRP